MVRTTFFLIFSLFTQALIAQWKDEEFGKHPHALKFSFINVLDPIIPNIELAYEYRLNDKVGLQISGATLMKQYLFSGDPLDIEGYRWKFEGRLYNPIKNERNIDYYFAVEYMQHYEKTNDINLKFSPSGNCSQHDNLNYFLLTHYNDTVNLSRRLSALNFKYGFMDKLYKQFYFDVYMGVGIKWREVNHANRICEEDELFSWFRNRNREGEESLFNALFNVRLTYIF